MFQNIQDNEEQYNNIEDVEEKNNINIKKILKDLFTKNNMLLYIISFMVSTIGFGEDINPFSIAILAAVCSNNIPIGVVYILTLIGTGIGFGKDGLLVYFFTSLIFIITLSMSKIKYDDKNNNKKLCIRVCLATAITQLLKLMMGRILVYDVLVSITYIIAVAIFYKIFESSVRVIRDLKDKKVFSVEEVLATSLIIAIAVTGFRDILIFGYSLKNVLCILIVLVLGWQNGVLVGATAGITIGLVVGIIGGGDIIQIASYAISGMIAGLLNKLGKIGVIVGFILGNGLLIYISKGDMSSIIRFQEILIASIGLLALPKNVKINIDDLFSKEKYFPVMKNNKIEENHDTIFKLNNVSEVINEVAKSYKEVAATVAEEKITDKYFETFKNEFEKNIETLEDNILYNYIIDDYEIYEDIFKIMKEKKYILKQDILDILEKNNEYIIQTDDEETNKKIDNDINNIIRAISSSYRVSKLNSIYDKKIEKSKENMGSQLEGISYAINSIAKNISEEINKNDIEEEKLKDLLNKRGLDVSRVKIKRNAESKIEINVYTSVCNSSKIEECKCEKIEKIINKNIKENVKLVTEKCSKTLNSDICKLKYTNKNNYALQIGISKVKKYNSIISGDSSINLNLEDGKKLIAISDGMGSGPKAKESSTIAIKLLKNLLLSGFDKETSIKLINSNICLNSKDETYATLDMAIIDLYKGNIEFIKNGACPTYIKNKRNVDVIKTISIPTGILEDIDLDVFDRDIGDGDILVMCSDGIIESNTEYENKELWLKYFLENIESENAQKIADLIMQEAIDNSIGKPKDDMIVVTIKVQKIN